MIPADKIQVTTVIPKKVRDRVHKLAERIGYSDSAMMCMLLEMATSDIEWVANSIGSRMVQTVKAVRSVFKGSGEDVKAEGA